MGWQTLLLTRNGNINFLNNSSTSGYSSAINTLRESNINADGSNILFSVNTDSRGRNSVHLDTDSSLTNVGTMNLNVANDDTSSNINEFK